MEKSSFGYKKKAWILTFYAFKGGTGRTLALSNVARYLAEEKGYRVGIIDLDLDSPGLPHQALCSALDFSDPGYHAPAHCEITSRESVLDEIDATRGFIDLFNDLHDRYYAKYISDRDCKWDSSRIEIAFEELSKSVIPLPSSGHNGTVLLIPAGKGSVRRPPNFLAGLRKFSHLISLPAGASKSKNQVGQFAPTITSAILDRFIQEYSLDFVFLDGRTGTGAFFSVYAMAIPHALVLFAGLNDQNIQGSLKILDSTCQGTRGDAPVFLVASPVPTAGAHLLESRIESLEKELARKRADRKENLAYIYECPSEIEFMFPYVDLATAQETYFIRQYPRSPLTREYIRLAKNIESLVVKPDTGFSITGAPDERQLLCESLDRAASCGHPLRFAIEEVHFQAMNQFLTECVTLKPLSPMPQKTEHPRALAYGDFPGRPLVEVQCWSATERSSPWEELLGAFGHDLASGNNPDLPDILTIPQNLLSTIVIRENADGRKAHPSRFVNIGNFALQPFKSDANLRLNFLDYRFLDGTYPGWRRWCTYGGEHYALPFSANTTLLCANNQHLKTLCRTYWHNRDIRTSDPGDFLPSTWYSLMKLIEADTGTSCPRAFGFASEGRGLYYEWLNVVLSLGELDVEIGEGDLIADCRIAHTVEPTRLFLDLMSRTHSRGKSPSMSDLITQFAAGQLSIYVAWTDSFRFDWNSSEVPVKVLPVSIPGTSGPHEVDIRFGPIPREVAYRRRPLLGNWVMVFPTPKNNDRKEAALRLGDFFLQPKWQRRLLKHGFPSSSMPVIDAEMQSEPLHERHDVAPAGANYRVFLRSLKEALAQGHLVLPTPVSPSIIKDICDCLESLKTNPTIEHVNNELAKVQNRFFKKCSESYSHWRSP